MIDSGNKFNSRLAEVLVNSIPEAWSRAEVHAELDEGTGQIATTYWSESGEEKQVFLEMELYPILKEWRQVMDKSERGSWYVLDFQLSRDGKFSVDFGYEKMPWMKF